MSSPVSTAELPAVVGRLVNPVLRALLRSPRLHRLVSRDLMLLSVTGRRTGRRIEVPLGRHELDGEVLAIGGGRWRFNVAGGAPVAVWLDGRRRTGHGRLVDDPDEVTRVYVRLLERVGTRGAQRLGLRVAAGVSPTPAQIREAVAGTRGIVVLALDRP